MKNRLKYYTSNPFKFYKDYFWIELTLFQKILIFNTLLVNKLKYYKINKQKQKLIKELYIKNK